jgi:DNA polymerase III delta subunit
MLYFIYGDDKEKARAKTQDLIGSLQKKKPDAAFFKVTTENFSESELEGLMGGQGLFENKYIVFFDSVFENKEFKESIGGKLKEIAQSANVFIFLEGKMEKKMLEKVEKHAEKVQEFSNEKKEGRTFGTGGGKDFNLKEFNIFSLGEAFGNRDRKNLWVIYQKALMRDLPSEEIHGILFWQWKSMVLAEEAKTAGEAGLNPYVFQKSKNFAKNFKEGELQKIGKELVSMYHDAHRGVHDFPTALEGFILKI